MHITKIAIKQPRMRSVSEKELTAVVVTNSQPLYMFSIRVTNITGTILFVLYKGNQHYWYHFICSL